MVLYYKIREKKVFKCLSQAAPLFKWTQVPQRHQYMGFYPKEIKGYRGGSKGGFFAIFPLLLELTYFPPLTRANIFSPSYSS